MQTLPCPSAYVRPGRPLGSVIAAEEMAYAARALGHPCPPAEALAMQVADLVDGRGTSDLLRIALVPSGSIPPAATTKWESVEVVAFPAEIRVPSGVIIVPAPWPINEASPATPLRLTTHAESNQGRRFATDAGADVAYWVNLMGQVARVDEWTVVADVGDHAVAPPVGAGAPFDAWADRLVQSDVVRRAAVPQALIEDPRTPLAAVLPWGEAVPCGTSRAHLELSRTLASRLTTALHSIT
jgi:hypothetical protein